MNLENKNTLKQNNKSKISVFDFSDYKDYLNAALFPEGNYNHQANTLSKWAKKLGYRSPSTLAMVLGGQRLPSLELASTLILNLRLKGKEKEYFQLLIELERKKRKDKNSDDILKRLQKINTRSDYFQVDLGHFNSVSKWYYYVIKQLVGSPDFVEDIDWIHKKLKRKVTPLQIKKAINELLELEMLTRENGKLVKPKIATVTTNDIPSAAIKEHHTGMMQRACDSLHEVPVEKRQISSLTLRMNTEKISEAKDELMSFLKDFNEKYYNEEATDVYQLNLQLFSHTKEINN